MDLVSIETPSENDLIEELITGGEKVLPDDISKILKKFSKNSSDFFCSI